MRSLSFLIVLGLSPLHGQTSVDDSAKVEPTLGPDATEIAPAPKEANSAISTNITIPAMPKVGVRLDRFTVTPTTIREGFIYREGAKTVVTLTAPATRTFTCTVVSSDPASLASGVITFQVGQQVQNGGIFIKWKHIKHNTEVTLKIYDPEQPETVLRSRIYLRTDPARTELDEAPAN